MLLVANSQTNASPRTKSLSQNHRSHKLRQSSQKAIEYEGRRISG